MAVDGGRRLGGYSLNGQQRPSASEGGITQSYKSDQGLERVCILRISPALLNWKLDWSLLLAFL